MRQPKNENYQKYSRKPSKSLNYGLFYCPYIPQWIIPAEEDAWNELIDELENPSEANEELKLAMKEFPVWEKESDGMDNNDSVFYSEYDGTNEEVPTKPMDPNSMEYRKKLFDEHIDFYEELYESNKDNSHYQGYLRGLHSARFILFRDGLDKETDQ